MEKQVIKLFKGKKKCSKLESGISAFCVLKLIYNKKRICTVGKTQNLDRKHLNFLCIF